MRLLFNVMTSAVCISLCACASVQTKQLNTWDEQVVQGKLDNGLTYYLYNSNDDQDPFNIRVMVHAGSIDEPQVMGIAHAVEHMVFNQTADHPEKIHYYLDELGWQSGKQINAVTSPQLTQYMIRTRPNDSLNVKQSLDLLADMLGSAQFSEAQWQLEQQVIVEEKRLGNHVAGRVNQLIKQSTKEGSKYAEGSVIGTFESINAISIDDLIAFYNKRYVASNMTLIISGNLNIDETHAAIENSFGQLPAHSRPPQIGLEFPLDERIKLNKVQDAEGSTSRATLGYRMAIANRGTAEGVRARLENYLLRKLMFGQLRRNNAYLPQSVNRLNGVLQLPSPERMTLAFSAGTDQHDDGVKAILDEVERMRRYGFDADEFAIVKANAYGVVDRQAGSRDSMTYAQWEDKITNTVVTGGALMGPVQQSQLTKSLLDEITLEDINKRFTAMTDAKDIFIYYQAPLAQTLILPTPEQVAGWRSDLIESSILEPVPYSVPVSSTPSDNVDPVSDQPVDIEIRLPTLPFTAAVLPTKIIEAEQTLYEWRLAGGHRFIWLNRPTEDGQLYLKSITDVGRYNHQYPAYLVDSAIQLKAQAAPAGFTAEQWQQWQQLQQVEWQFALQDQHLDISIAVPTDKLDEALHAYHLLHQPFKLDSDALAAALESLTELHASEQQVPIKNRSSYLRFGESMLSGITEQKLDELSVSQLEQAADAFASAPFTLFVVGEAELEVIQDYIGRYLQPLNAKQTLEPTSIVQKGGDWNHTINDIGAERAETVLYGSTPMQWTPERAFMVSAMNSIVQRALQRRLRLELGGVYRVTYEMQLNSDNDHIESRLFFVSSQERAEELLVTAQEVLRDLSGSIQTQDFGKIQEDIRYAEEGRLGIASTWLRRLMLSYRAYDDARYLDSMFNLAEQVSEESLQQLVEEIFPLADQTAIKTIYQPQVQP